MVLPHVSGVPVGDIFWAKIETVLPMFSAGRGIVEPPTKSE